MSAEHPEDPAAAPVTVRWVRDARDLRAALALRFAVFCDEQGVPREIEVDALDDVARHAVAVAPDGTVVGTMRLIAKGSVVKVGRVAVARAWRGRGIASDLLARAMDYAQGLRAEELRLAAQVAAIDLYRKAGYRAVGRPFEEAGIEHVWMVREVVPPRRPHRRPTGVGGPPGSAPSGTGGPGPAAGPGA
jgi:predicted GNAT family N-acyltransferase